jgi:hypothetical protein
VATPSVATVEKNRLGGIETLHEFPEVGFAGHQKEVKMGLFAGGGSIVFNLWI